MHVTQNEFAMVAKVFAIHLALVLINIVGKCYAPTSTFQTNAHQSDASKKLADFLFAECFHLCRRYICTISPPHSISI